jgi:protein-S-isoprenylcysteine O-methyltransferase Ste14
MTRQQLPLVMELATPVAVLVLVAGWAAYEHVRIRRERRAVARLLNLHDHGGKP